MTVNVNGVEDSTQEVSLDPVKLGSLGITPNNVSPILKTWVTITLDSTFPETMVLADFKAKLKSTDTSSDFTPLEMYIYEVNDGDKTLRVKFPGAPSGEYKVELTHESIGRIDVSALVITTEAKVTGLSANSGSSLGGQVLTITGTNFSDDPYDNPVQVDGYDCFVLTTSTTEITCRIDEVASDTPTMSTGIVVVFLSTSEEAATDVDMEWTWASSSGTVETLTSAFDPATNKEIVTVTGLGLTDGDTSGVSLYIDGVLQTTLSVTAEEVVI